MKLFFALVFALSLAVGVHAESTATHNPLTYSLSVAPMGISTQYRLQAQRVSAGIEINRHLITLAGAWVHGKRTGKNNCIGCSGNSYEQTQNNVDIGLLYGRKLIQRNWGFFAVHAGFAHNVIHSHRHQREKYFNSSPPMYYWEEVEDIDGTAWSFPLDLQLFFQVVKIARANPSLADDRYYRLGLGLDLFANINRRHSYGGGTLALRFGT